MITTVDADFLALPLEKVSEAALSAATGAGASHADVRIERTRTGLLSLRDAKPETQSDETNFGIGVRVIVNGAWGFASSPDVSVETAQKLAMTAVAMAKTSTSQTICVLACSKIPTAFKSQPPRDNLQAITTRSEQHAFYGILGLRLIRQTL